MTLVTYRESSTYVDLIPVLLAQLRQEGVDLRARVMEGASSWDLVQGREGTHAPIVGRTVIDARGLVVAPGSIDLHQHAQDSAAHLVMVRDGTTTALELEDGTGDVDAWYIRRAGRSAVRRGPTRSSAASSGRRPKSDSPARRLRATASAAASSSSTPPTLLPVRRGYAPPSRTRSRSS